MAEREISMEEALKTIQNGIIRDPVRAAALGLIPAEGHNVSERFQFIINPSNVEELEDKKMRSYRPKDFGRSGKTLYGWGIDPNHPELGDGPLDLVVYNKAEEEKALAAGWKAEPQHGPAGKLEGGVAAPEAEPVKAVREFAAPGQFQPFDHNAQQAAAPAATAKKAGRKPTTKKKVQ